MQRNNLVKFGMVLLLLLLLVVAAVPAMAQEPDGKVDAQTVGFINFYWDPQFANISLGDGTLQSRLHVIGAEDISGFSLTIGYDSSILSPDAIKPGALLPGTRGVDYIWFVQTGGVAVPPPAPPPPPNFPPPPPPAPAPQCGGDAAFTIYVAYLNPSMMINGTGPLVDILWRNGPNAAVNAPGIVCLDGATSQVVDNGGFPAPLVVPSPVAIYTIGPPTQGGFKIFIGLEGGKPSGWANTTSITPDLFTDVTVNNFPCDTGKVDGFGYCAFNNSLGTGPPFQVKANRIGYLPVNATFAQGSDATSIWLMAGDLNSDNVINILDIQLMASLLGTNLTVGPPHSTSAYAADYTGYPVGAPGIPPGQFGPDGLVNIIDLVLVAKNFGTSGPTNGTPPPGGTFPY